MEENEKIDEAVDYVKWMLNELDPDEMYNFTATRQKLLAIIGYLTILKTR